MTLILTSALVMLAWCAGALVVDCYPRRPRKK